MHKDITLRHVIYILDKYTTQHVSITAGLEDDLWNTSEVVPGMPTDEAASAADMDFSMIPCISSSVLDMAPNAYFAELEVSLLCNIEIRGLRAPFRTKHFGTRAVLH